MTAATVRPTDGWKSADAWAALHRAETSPHELASIARDFPHYAEQIAAHPRAYPALIEWAGVVAGGRRATPAVAAPAVAGVTDLPAGRRRDSGAHPLAFSADADAWRAAVAAGAALTQGAEPSAGTRAWWADVTPRAAPALPASSAPTASPALPASSARTASPALPASPEPTASHPAHAAASTPTGGEHPTGAVNSKALLGFVFAFVLAPLGIVFAHLALRDIARTGEAGRGYARAGLIIGYTVVGLGAMAAGIALWVVLSG
ncbi:DUF4190 domain-containing protein [Microbacterium sp. zg.Y625]|uniref:DUF4190 domain-containing protein n=1 Tax=Microbacterium jiangjiandongii TaxID=3049071 RepID=UPI00214C6FCE|nr:MULTISPECIES: DUF4190 domain-containing protein [unclassified Microbacterium]MCR2791938.1 DUF4190 domain-containing protein [Microbacterium sp. zg.Y625]WIM24750.1 DUF4190 domain-containing protein [Microbacterium sp. zg-Y625]